MMVLKSIKLGIFGTWIQIGLIFLSNIILVPFFLKNWDLTTYGAWLTFQSIIFFLQILDFGYNAHMGRLLNLTAKINTQEYSKKISEIFTAGTLFSIITNIILFFGLKTELLNNLIAKTIGDSNIATQFVSLLYLQFIVNIFQNIAGMFTKFVVPLGYYSFGISSLLLLLLVQLISQLIACILQKNLFQLGQIWAVSNLLFFGASSCACLLILAKSKIFIKIKYNYEAIINLFKSLALSFVSITNNFRQQGIRLIISYYISPTALSQFVTLRTIANVNMQFGSSVLGILAPHFTRTILSKDPKDICTYLTKLWCGIFLLVPIGSILLLLSQEYFSIWTHGKIELDEKLLKLLIVASIFYVTTELSQLAVICLNPLKEQMIISFFNLIFGLLLIYCLTIYFKIYGTCIGILIFENISFFIWTFVSKKIFLKEGIIFPFLRFVIFQILLMAVCATFYFLV